MPAKNSADSQRELGADIVQILLGSPRKWNNEQVPEGTIASPFYVHSPYLINLSTWKPDLLEKSIRTLYSQAKMSSELGAEGLVLHGGSWKKGDRLDALMQWRDALLHDGHYQPLPILIENAASGDHSLTRYATDFIELWRLVDGPTRNDIGWCLDTAHLWAASDRPETELSVMLEFMGSPDLIHANGSSAEPASKMDRHHPWARSRLAPDRIVKWIEMSGCKNVIVESSDPKSDIELMKEMLI